MTEKKKSGSEEQATQGQVNLNAPLPPNQTVKDQGTAEPNSDDPDKDKRIGKKRTFRDKWRLTSLSNKIISICTIAIAGASILQFGTSFLQWQDMGRQLSDFEASQAAQIVIEGFAEAANTNIQQIVLHNVGQSVALGLGTANGNGVFRSDTRQIVMTPSQSLIETVIKPFSPFAAGPSIAPGAKQPWDINVGHPSQSPGGPLADGTMGEFEYVSVAYWDIFHRPHWVSDCIFYNRKFNRYFACPSGHNNQ